MTRLLVMGVGGVLGSAIEAQAGKSGIECVGVGRSVNVSDYASVARIVDQIEPTHVIDCAVFHKRADSSMAEDAENDPESAWRVNVLGAWNVGRVASSRGISFAYISSDYVFRGDVETPYTSHDSPDAISVYGRTKAEGESAVLRSGGFVFRTAALIGRRPGSPLNVNFVDKIVAKLQSGEMASVVTDQFMSPSFAADVAASLLATMEAHPPGVYHVVGSGVASWFEVACEVARCLGFDPTEYLREHYLEELPRTYPRPRFTALVPHCEGQLPPWREALSRFMRG